MPRPRAPLFLTLLLLAACGAEAPDLRVGDVEFSRAELLGVTEENERILAAITAVGLAVAQGEVEKLGAPLLERRRREALVARLADEIVVAAAGADEQALRTHYLTNPEHELTVRHIVVLSDRREEEPVRAEARRRAAEALERVRSGESFSEVAAEVSEEPGAEGRGGRLEPGRRGSWVPGFWDAASALEVGEHTGVVETRYGFHVIKLEERKVVPFEEARPRVVAGVAELVGDDGAWRRWADSAVASGLTLRSEAVDRWRRGEASDTTSVATWEGGRWTAAELEEWATTTETRGDGPARATTEGASEPARAGARLAFLAHLARDRGLEPSPGEVESATRAWEERVHRWAAALGFLDAGTGSPYQDDVASRALEGFTSGAQGARIARREIRSHLPLLLRGYPVEGLDASESDAGEGRR